MKVAILGYDHSVDDKRVFRTVKTLSKYHDVVYVYRQDESKKEIEEELKREYPHIEFVPIVLKERSPRGIYTFDKENVEAVIESDADVWYLHTAPDTRPLQLFTEGKRRGKRIIYDSHELVPYNWIAGATRKVHFVDRIRRLIAWDILYTQVTLSDCVIDTSYARLVYWLHRLHLRKFRNYLVLPNLAEYSIDISIDSKENIFAFVGSTRRNIDITLIKKVHDLTGWRFVYVSSSPDSILDSIPWITYHEVMKYDEMMQFLSKAMFSIIAYEAPYGQEMNYYLALPHKFFDSLAAGTPVIVGDRFIEMKAFTKKWNVGYVSSEVTATILDEYEKLLSNVKMHQSYFTWNDRWEKNLLCCLEV